MQTILITTSSFGSLEKLTQNGYNVITNPYGRKLTETEVSDLITAHRPLGLLAGVEPLTEKVIKSAMPNLKIISRCGIGMDSVDLEAAKKYGIHVSNTPDAPTIPVAELTLGMMLAMLRQMHVSDAAIREGRWERPMGRLLFRKTVGIIGCGRIGSHLARLLSVFDCRVLGVDPARPQNEFLQYVELEALLAASDIVSLHLPYSSAFHHFIDANRLRIMKKGAFLVNAARGGLVDEQALLGALQAGHLDGAALDCFEQEPYQGPLKNLGNVLLTGHIGSYAKEARVMMEMQAVDNLLAAMSG